MTKCRNLFLLFFLFFISFLFNSFFSYAANSTIRLTKTNLSQNNSYSIYQGDYNVLEDIFYMDNGTYWNWRNRTGNIWNFSSNDDPCLDNWQGVQCQLFLNISIQSYRIVAINLTFFNLTGPFPYQVNNLYYLERLALQNNRLSGILPNISHLPHLKVLNIAYNDLVGTIPESFGSLNSLEYFQISANKYIFGTIPDSLFNLTNLRVILFNINHLSGTISENFNKLINLGDLVLGHNQLKGTIPPLGDLQNLKFLYFDTNHLTGTIPPSIFQLKELLALHLFNNRLNGTLPEGLKKLTKLQYLVLNNNSFSGTIPNEFRSMVSLRFLGLAENNFEGSIPNFIPTSKLRNLQLQMNRLNGTIPYSIGKLNKLMEIYLYSNYLTGSIPESLFDLNHLVILNLYNNSLSGTISTNISRLVNLNNIALGQNKFYGTIPELGEMNFLVSLYLNSNNLTGTIPTSIVNQTRLSKVYLSNNMLNGTLPNYFSNLISLDVSNNYLFGKIPIELSLVPTIRNVYLEFNYFSGNVDFLTNFKVASNIYLNNNRFTGTIPIFKHYTLSELSIEYNQLKGTIPESLGHCGQISILKLDSNQLTGSIPLSFTNLTRITVLQLQKNRLTGQLAGLFNEAMFPYLYQIDLSSNILTGTIPGSIFKLPSLITLSLSKNCFHGSLPDDICLAKRLSILALDGLTSSSECLIKFWDIFGLIKGNIAYSMKGTIPSCIWDLKFLSTLHLSGNQFTGNIELKSYFGSDVANLSDLTLSHNQLSGTIPDRFSQIDFSSIDLSYNNFFGDLDNLNNISLCYGDNFNGTQVILNVNKFSGNIPSKYYSANNVNLLSGNLFGCKNGNHLPENDPNYSSYICGSDQFDRSLISLAIMFSILTLALTILSIISCRIKKFFLRVKNYYQSLVYTIKFVSFLGFDLDSATIINSLNDSGHSVNEILIYSKFPDAFRFLISLNLIRLIFVVLCSYAIFICMPIYLLVYYIDSYDYSSYWDQYTWKTTSVFFVGTMPAVLMLCLWLMILCVFMLFVLWYYGLLKRESIRNISVGLNSVSVMSRATFQLNMLTRFSIMSRQESVAWSSSTLSPFSSVESKPSSYDARVPELISYPNQDNKSINKTDRKFNSPKSIELSVITKNPDIESDRILSPSDITINSMHRKKLDSSDSAESDFTTESIEIPENKNNSLPRYNILLRFIIVFSLNAFVTLFINGVYILAISQYNINSINKIFLQVLIAGFKLIWNLIAVRNLIEYLPYHEYTVKFHVVLLIFNNLIAPCLASSFNDSFCFEDLVYGSNTVTSSYEYETCSLYVSSFVKSAIGDSFVSTICGKYTSTVYSTTYDPGFIYYFSCGSQLLISYIPVYFYCYTIILFFVPLVYFHLATARMESLSGFIKSRLIGILRPQDKQTTQFKYLFRPHNVQIIYIQHFIVFFVYGINAPLLAFVLGLAIIVNTFIWQLLIIRYIKSESNDSPFSFQFADKDDFKIPSKSSQFLLNRSKLSDFEFKIEYDKIKEINQIVKTTWKSLKNSHLVIYICSMIFYTFLLVDMTGSRGGLQSSYWVFICMPIFTIVIPSVIVIFIKTSNIHK